MIPLLKKLDYIKDISIDNIELDDEMNLVKNLPFLENFNNKRINRPKVEKECKSYFTSQKLKKKLDIFKKEEKNDLISTFKIFLSSYEFINQANQYKDLKFPSNFEMKNLLNKSQKDIIQKIKKNKTIFEKENEKNSLIKEQSKNLKNYLYEIIKKENNFYYTVLKVFDTIDNKIFKNLLKINKNFYTNKSDLEENAELIKNEAILRTREMIEKVELVMEENSILRSELGKLKKSKKEEKNIFLKELKKLEKENVNIKIEKKK